MSEALEISKKFLKENNLISGIDPIKTIHKVKSRYKIKAIKTIINKNVDYHDLRKTRWITDKEIVDYVLKGDKNDTKKV